MRKPRHITTQSCKTFGGEMEIEIKFAARCVCVRARVRVRGLRGGAGDELNTRTRVASLWHLTWLTHFYIT